MNYSAVTFLLLTIAISAGASNFNWMGVWKGTVGKKRVTVCVTNSYHIKKNFFGSYYFVNKPVPTQFSVDSNLAATWKEFCLPDCDSCRIWEFDPPIGDTLTGFWSRRDKKNSLPVKLFRVNSRDTVTKNNPCGCDLYNLPLETIPPVRYGKILNFEGKRYREIRVTSGKLSLGSIEIIDSGATVAAINRELRRLLPRSKAEWEHYFDCRRDVLVSYGFTGDWVQNVEPDFWSDRFLSLCIWTSFYCAGAHPGLGRECRTWDLTTGKEVNLKSWIIMDEWVIVGKYSNMVQNIDGLIRTFADTAYCIKNLPSYDPGYSLKLGRNGLVFLPKMPLRMGCIDGIEVPFKKLTPFLTKQGRRGIAALIKGGEKK